MRIAAKSVEFELRRRRKQVAIVLECSAIDEAVVIFQDLVEASKTGRVSFRMSVGGVIKQGETDA